MATVRDLWEQKGFSPAQIAGMADISLGTLSKINRKQPVKGQTLTKLLKALEITREDYEKLEIGQ